MRRNKNYGLIQEAVGLWEEARRHDVTPDKRAKLVSAILAKCAGHIAELAGSHSASRVIQTCAKYGTPAGGLNTVAGEGGRRWLVRPELRFPSRSCSLALQLLGLLLHLVSRAGGYEAPQHDTSCLSMLLLLCKPAGQSVAHLRCSRFVGRLLPCAASSRGRRSHHAAAAPTIPSVPHPLIPPGLPPLPRAPSRPPLHTYTHPLPPLQSGPPS